MLKFLYISIFIFVISCGDRQPNYYYNYSDTNLLKEHDFSSAKYIIKNISVTIQDKNAERSSQSYGYLTNSQAETLFKDIIINKLKSTGQYAQDAID